MKLPLVDEVREARRLAEEAARAGVHVQQIRAVLTSLDVLQQQVTLRPSVHVTVPGDSLVASLAEDWPSLADLESNAPRHAHTVQVGLAMRRAQLDLALQVLKPLAHDANSRAQVLHGLQHRQREALNAPRWQQAVAELADLGAARDRLAAELQPLDQRLAMVAPALNVLHTFVSHLAREVDGVTSRPDPYGHLTWRVAYLANTLVESLREILDRVQLEVPLPEPPRLPPEPDPAQCQSLLLGVREVHGALAELEAVLAREHGVLQQQRDDRARRHEALTLRIVDRMG